MNKYCQIQSECKILKECKEKLFLVENESIKKSQAINDLTTSLNFTARQYETLQKKYVEVLRLAKENADSYEYCLKNLEEEIARFKK